MIADGDHATHFKGGQEPMELIATKCFARLYCSARYPDGGWYIVTIEDLYDRAFAAANDEDAIKKAGWNPATLQY